MSPQSGTLRATEWPGGPTGAAPVLRGAYPQLSGFGGLGFTVRGVGGGVGRFWSRLFGGEGGERASPLALEGFLAWRF